MCAVSSSLVCEPLQHVDERQMLDERMGLCQDKIQLACDPVVHDEVR